MQPKYTFAQLEANGVEATARFHVTTFEGWVMDDDVFVHYADDRQQLIPTSEIPRLRIENWSNHGTLQTRLNAVIRFNRAVQFPKFSMKAGERWGFAVFRKTIDHIKAIQAGDRFAFAGGECLAQDVDIVYIGSDDFHYSRATGAIK